METLHHIISGDARDLGHLDDESVRLILTSSPYPMVTMWDDVFCKMSSEAAQALDARDGWRAFEAMHQPLDKA